MDIRLHIREAFVNIIHVKLGLWRHGLFFMYENRENLRSTELSNIEIPLVALDIQ